MSLQTHNSKYVDASILYVNMLFFFFFQAEDGIRDYKVTGVQTCALPISQYPRLAGQHADYTTTQLTAFRDGKRGNSIQMTQVAAKLNDREIKAVADYIAGLR